jgi:hypothetical protein
MSAPNEPRDSLERDLLGLRAGPVSRPGENTSRSAALTPLEAGLRRPTVDPWFVPVADLSGPYGATTTSEGELR